MQTTLEEEGRVMEEVMEEERSWSSATAMMRRRFFLQRGSAASHACVHRDREGLFDSTPSALCHLGTGGKLMKTYP